MLSLHLHMVLNGSGRDNLVVALTEVNVVHRLQDCTSTGKLYGEVVDPFDRPK